MDCININYDTHEPEALDLNFSLKKGFLNMFEMAQHIFKLYMTRNKAIILVGSSETLLKHF